MLPFVTINYSYCQLHETKTCNSNVPVTLAVTTFLIYTQNGRNWISLLIIYFSEFVTKKTVV